MPDPSPPPARLCGSCRHWHRRPADISTLGQTPLGLCLALPPQVHLVPAPHGQVGQTAAYPQLPENFQGCGMHEARVALSIAGGGGDTDPE